MIKWTMCYVFGHKPHDYDFHGAGYTECSRCAKRKNLNARGWG